jgi:pullulanase/glycogen debranching enzyme
MNFLLAGALRDEQVNSGSIDEVRAVVQSETTNGIRGRLRLQALQQVRSAFALLLTSVGIPMFLAGEEFADVHDLDPLEGSQKMSDPVNFLRAELSGHKELRAAVKQLITLRTSHQALRRNEIEFLYVHPTFDTNSGERVFVYCRNGGSNSGDANTRQVVVVANCGPQSYQSFDVPAWPWQKAPQAESGADAGAALPQWIAAGQLLRLSLKPFQVRVFTM